MAIKYTIIPKGYRLTVTSWENDADNYNTKSMEGLTKEEIEFLVPFIKLFKSKNSHNDNTNFGNMYSPDEDEIEQANEAVRKLVSKHDVVNFSFGDYFSALDGEDDEHSAWSDFLYNLGLSGGEYFTRVLSSYKIEYIPEELKIQDVTKEF